MKIRIFILLIFVMSTSPQAWANIQDIKKLRNLALEFAQDYYHEKFEYAHGTELDIKVSPLDKRLRLANCDDFLTFSVKQSPGNHSNASIHVQCQAYSQWSIYIPIRINRYGDVVAVRSNIAKGTLLRASDLVLQRVNLSNVRGSYYEEIEQAINMELKRPLKAGTVIGSNHVQAPKIVIKGQEVMVESNIGSLSVTAPAIALRSASLGEQVKVRNSQSNRVIYATVTAPGVVSVSPQKR